MFDVKRCFKVKKTGPVYPDTNARAAIFFFLRWFHFVYFLQPITSKDESLLISSARECVYETYKKRTVISSAWGCCSSHQRHHYLHTTTCRVHLIHVFSEIPQRYFYLGKTNPINPDRSQASRRLFREAIAVLYTFTSIHLFTFQSTQNHL